MSCHICNYWTPDKGCRHYGAKEEAPRIISEIVAFAHLENTSIQESADFKQGALHAMLFIDKNLLKGDELLKRLPLITKSYKNWRQSKKH